MYYKIDPETLREKIIDLGSYAKEVELYQIKISQNDMEYASHCSKLGDLYRIKGELIQAKFYLNKALNALSDNPDEQLRLLTELRWAIVNQWEQAYDESEKRFESLEALTNGTLESFVYQHRAMMEYERNNLWLALNYFEKARRLRLEDEELLDSTDMGIHRVKMLLRLK